MAIDELVPFLAAEPADLVIVAFGVNDAMAYRSPAGFANDLAALVKAVRRQVGEAAVVIGGVAPLAFFPGLPLPLRQFSVGAAPRYRLRPSGSAHGCPVWLSSDFPRASCRNCLPVMAFIPMRARMRYGGRRSRHWRCRCCEARSHLINGQCLGGQRGAAGRTRRLARRRHGRSNQRRATLQAKFCPSSGVIQADRENYRRPRP